MPLLNFKKQFAPLIEIGLKDPDHPKAKRTTIRAWRKDGKDPKPEDTLYLYMGLRTKSSRRLGVVPCVQTEPICILEWGDIVLGTKELDFYTATRLTIKDGFESFQAFMDFFRKTHDLPFFGVWIKW